MKSTNTTKTSTYRKILAKEPLYLQVADRYKKFHKKISVSEDTYLHVFAPVLIEFVKWVLNTAINDGKKRLYFLSRDGYQMYLAARKLADINGIDIECRYLNVSRYALRVPEYHLIQEKCLARICIGGIDVTFEKVMRRAGLTDEEGREVAKLCGYEESYSDVISYRQVMDLKDILRKQSSFLEYVYKHSRESYESALGYLKQEGLLDEIPYAIVDSGWIGTLHQSLNNLLKSCGKDQKMYGYYFGLYETPKDSTDIYKAYFFEPGGDIVKKVNFSNCLFEAVFTSTEGMTLRYEETSDGYKPFFDNKVNPNEKLVQRHIELLQEYIGIYSEEVARCGNITELKKGSTNDDTLKMVEKLLKNMMGSPSREELEAYGNSQFSDDVLEGSLQKVAAELSDEEIRNQRFINKALIMTGLKKGIIHESAWIEGSIVRNGKKIKANLRHAKVYKYFVYIRKMFR